MEQHTSQEEIRRTIIRDMVKKRGSIVPVIGEDTIVYSLCIPSILFWLSYGALKWICSTYEEGSKIIQRNMQLTNIDSVRKPKRNYVNINSAIRLCV